MLYNVWEGVWIHTTLKRQQQYTVKFIVMFTTFVYFGQTVLYPKWLKFSSAAEDTSLRANDYGIVWLNGCAISMGTSHILIEVLAYWLMKFNDGMQLNHLVRVLNATTNHLYITLISTICNDAWRNDNTLLCTIETIKQFTKEAHLTTMLLDCKFTSTMMQ